MKSKWLIGLAAVILIGALGSYFVVGNSGSQGDGGSYLEDGRKYLEKGDLASAVIQLKNAAREDPENAEGRWLLGRTYIRIGNFPSAEKELRSAVRLGIDEAKVVADIAMAYMRQGKFAEILADIKSGNRDPSTEGKILAYRGFAHIGSNQIEEAEKSLRKAIALAPTLANAHLGMAVLHRLRKDLVAAEKAVDVALSHDPVFAEALSLKGQLRRSSGDVDGAMAAFDGAIELNRGDFAARLGRAAINIGRNEDEKARQDIDAVTSRVKKHPIAAYLNALLLAKEKKDAEAIVLLQGTGSFLQSYPPGLYLLAYLQLRQNQIVQAEVNLKLLLQRVPGEITATKLLAGIYLRKNQSQKSVDLLAKLVTDDTQDNDLISLLASSHLRAGNSDEAARLFEIVAKDRPDDPELKTRLALTRLQGGQTETAVADLHKILKTNPDAARAHILLVLTELRQNNFDAALDAAENLKKNLKDNPLPDNLLGGIWVRKGNIVEARKHFAAALALNGKFIPALLNLAQIDLAEKKPAEAKANYLKIVEIDDKNVAAMMALSRMALISEDRDGAVSWLKKAIAARPKAIQPRLRLVDYYLAVRDNSAGLVAARDMVQAIADNALAMDAMGRAQMASKQYASALSSYRRVVKLVPKAPVAHHRLAVALVSINNMADARKSFEKALELAPNYLPAYMSLIGLEVREKKFAEALVIAEGLREKFPKRPVADLAIGDIRMSAGEYKEAIAAFERAAKVAPSSRTTIRLFQARISGKQEATALAGMKAWLEKNTKDNSVRFALASHYLSKGNMDAARGEHEILYELEPDNQIVLNNLAWLYDKLDDPRAVALAEKAYAKSVRSPTIKDTLGWILFRRGDAKRGRELITDAAKVLINNAEVQYHYAYALNADGEKELAKAVLEKILVEGVRPFSEIEEARALLRSLQQ